MNVQLVNEEGQIVGYKDRQAIDRHHDFLHSVLVLAKTADEKFLLSFIPTEKHLPLFAGKLGASAATFAREHESAEQAARRLPPRERQVLRFGGLYARHQQCRELRCQRRGAGECERTNCDH